MCRSPTRPRTSTDFSESLSLHHQIPDGRRIWRMSLIIFRKTATASCASCFSLSLFLSFYACAYARVSERGASSRETRSSGNLVLSFLSSPMVVHRLLIRFIFNSAERKAIVRGHDSSWDAWKQLGHQRWFLCIHENGAGKRERKEKKREEGGMSR